MVNEPSVFEPLKFYCIFFLSSTEILVSGEAYNTINNNNNNNKGLINSDHDNVPND